MWEKALEIASRITHPYTVAVFAAVIAAIVILYAKKAGQKPSRVIGIILAMGIVLSGLMPTIASTVLELKGIYHIRIVVLDSNKQPIPVGDANVSASAGGELKGASSNWEFDLPPQAKPADSKVTFFASLKNGFLSGNSTLLLERNYFPQVTVQLVPPPAVTLRGVVEDDHGKSVSGAAVSVVGYPDMTKTDSMGNFVLPSHAADGESVQVRAEKGELTAQELVIAGKPIVLVARKH